MALVFLAGFSAGDTEISSMTGVPLPSSLVPSAFDPRLLEALSPSICEIRLLRNLAADLAGSE
jgi:hypothetical protein